MQAGPAYGLECRGVGDKPVHLVYRPHTSELVDENGTPLLADVVPHAFEPVERVSAAAPGWKSREVSTLKIQLGLRCNYSCSYCNQASAVADATVTRSADAQAFLERLGDWLRGAPRRIEFWGGEPLLYFAKLKPLVPALRQRFPAAMFSVVTNGSLLDGEILDFIETWDLHVAVSHDGPGQHLRGPDPFEDPVRAHWLREPGARGGSATIASRWTPRASSRSTTTADCTVRAAGARRTTACSTTASWPVSRAARRCAGAACARRPATSSMRCSGAAPASRSARNAAWMRPTSSPWTCTAT
jgi:hypothetical protein